MKFKKLLMLVDASVADMMKACSAALSFRNSLTVLR